MRQFLFYKRKVLLNIDAIHEAILIDSEELEYWISCLILK